MTNRPFLQQDAGGQNRVHVPISDLQNVQRPADVQTQLRRDSLLAIPQQIDDALVARAELAQQRRIQRERSRPAADRRRGACGPLPTRRLNVEEQLKCFVQLVPPSAALKPQGCRVLGQPGAAPQIAFELAGHGLRCVFIGPAGVEKGAAVVPHRHGRARQPRPSGVGERGVVGYFQHAQHVPAKHALFAQPSRHLVQQVRVARGPCKHEIR